MLERDIKTYLEADTDITHRATGGIYPTRAPQGTRGNVSILRTVSSDRNYSLTNEVDQAEFILQVDCYGKTPFEAEDLFQQVRNRLSGYRGTAGDGQIQGTRIVNELQFAEEPADASDQWIHRYTADFALFLDQTVPTHA